jgi:TatD DNase family protein
LQHAAFEEQLRLAQALDVPVILHILRAHEEALLVLRRVGLPRAGGVVHSYSGSAELVPRYLDLGLYLSFGGSITWGAASRAQRALQACPLERMLIETDAPDQTALEHRPAQNEPAFLGAVVQRAAALLGEAPAHVIERTRDNARELLRLSGDK